MVGLTTIVHCDASLRTAHSLTWPIANLYEYKYAHQIFMQWLATLWTKVFIMYEDCNAAMCAALLRETSNHTLKGRCAMKPADWGMVIDRRGVCVSMIVYSQTC